MSNDGLGQTLRAAREQRNASQDACAASCGLTIEEYGDVESSNLEFFDNISMGTARRICWFLRLDILELASRFWGVHPSSGVASDTDFFSRHHLVTNARLGKGLSPLELANAIGFSAITIEMLERSPDFIESLPLRTVSKIAEAIG